MTRTKPSRDEVLKYIDEHGATATEASKHFQGLRTAGVIRKWLSRRRHERGEPARKRGNQGTKKEGNTPSSVTSKAKPRAPLSKPRGAVLDPDKLEEAAKKGIRKAVMQRLEYLATKKSLKDPHQQKVAVTLGIILDKCPDILNLVDVPVAASTADEQLDRIRRVMMPTET